MPLGDKMASALQQQKILYPEAAADAQQGTV
jgi:hypothetical protein